MTTAADLLRAYVKGAHDGEAVARLFTQDGAVEAPFFVTFGMPWRFTGQPALEAAYTHLGKLYPGIRFENLRLIFAQDDLAVGEYEFIAQSAKTGRRVHQLTLAILAVEGGKIKRLREYQNIAEVALGMLPNGLGDVVIPENRALEIGQFS
jgi:ketosteroid isomerase-like protein